LTKKLYVCVRKDLSHSQRAVQAGHALAEYMLNSSEWKNSTLVYLGVKGLNQLENLKRKLEYAEIEHYAFTEPDLDNQITALASDRSSTIFDKLNLL
jgi:peptidyl-tRNA hydrolase